MIVCRIEKARGQRVQWPGVGDPLVRAVGVVELLELVQGVEQVPLVADQSAVEQFATRRGPRA